MTKLISVLMFLSLAACGREGTVGAEQTSIGRLANTSWFPFGKLPTGNQVCTGINATGRVGCRPRKTDR